MSRLEGYTNKDGIKKYFAEIIANKIIFLDKIERS